MAKVPGSSLRAGPACVAFRSHLHHVRTSSPPAASWATVESGFLRAMEAFDDLVIAGAAREGERQNGKGDYFNDLLANILEQASGVTLDRRSGVPGLVFPNHSLDVTYPQSGQIVEVLVEAKMLGTPRHPGNASTQKITGRPGSADMLKRCKEAGFKTIDLKAAYGMLQSQQGQRQQAGIAGDLTSWLRTAKPRSYLVAAVRVVTLNDLNAAIAMANAMTQVMDGVAIFPYRPRRWTAQSLSPAAYEAVAVPSNLDIMRVMQRIVGDLRAAQAAPEVRKPVSLPSEAVATAIEEARD